MPIGELTRTRGAHDTGGGVATPPGLSQRGGSGRVVGGNPQRPKAGAAIRAAHAAHRQAFLRAHDELWAARLGIRRERLSLPDDTPGDRSALACDASARAACLA